jgi:hypothetical protein
MAQTNFDLKGYLPLIASGKVRELYEIDGDTLLFVATDRISAYDVIMSNVSQCAIHVEVLRLTDSPAGCATEGCNIDFDQQVLVQLSHVTDPFT